MRGLAIGLAIFALLAACADTAAPVTSQPPPPAPTGEEADLELVACFEGLGYGVREIEGGWEWIHGGKTMEERMTDATLCYEEAFGPGSLTPRTLTETEIRRLYELNLESLDCLRTAGYAIPDPPSLDAYIESFTSGAGQKWYPHFSVEPHQGTSDAEFAQIVQTCPYPEL